MADFSFTQSTIANVVIDGQALRMAWFLQMRPLQAAMDRRLVLHVRRRVSLLR